MGQTFIDENGKEREDSLNEDSLIADFTQQIGLTDFKVYGLSGDWGTGKSTFINMWKETLDKDRSTVIVIDAFEKDYIQNPFAMIYDAFKIFMKENNISTDDSKNVVDKAKKIAFASLKAVGHFGVNLLIEKIGKETIKDLVTSISDSVFDEFDYNPENETESLYEEIKKELSTIVAKTGKSLYIVIDELDRCRPDFALETLEKIKHLFRIDNVKFILIYNPIVISKIVEKQYGISDSDNRYITKFIEKDIPFTIKHQLNIWIVQEAELQKAKQQNSMIYDFISACSNKIASLMLKYKISLRDIQRIFSSVDIDNGFKEAEKNIRMGVTMAFLKKISINEYNDIENYLRMNANLAVNAPNRGLYRELARIFLNMNDDIKEYIEKDLVSYFRFKNRNF